MRLLQYSKHSIYITHYSTWSLLLEKRTLIFVCLGLPRAFVQLFSTVGKATEHDEKEYHFIHPVTQSIHILNNKTASSYFTCVFQLHNLGCLAFQFCHFLYIINYFIVSLNFKIIFVFTACPISYSYIVTKLYFYYYILCLTIRNNTVHKK